MTVTVYNEAAASGALVPYVVGNATLESPDGLDSGATRQVQVSPVFRGTPRVFDRLNKQRSVAFSSFREHGSLDAAALFQLGHADESVFNSVATVVFTVGTTVKTLQNAKFQSIRVRLKGRTTTTQYTLVGTHFT